MMVTDPIADLLTRIRNAQRAGHRSCRIRKSNAGERVLKVLREEGFIESYEVRPERKPSGIKATFEEFEVVLKYFSSGDPVIGEVVRVSKPGKRVYRQAGEIKPVQSGLGISVISTSQGVISDRKARKLQIGGEVIATVG